MFRAAYATDLTAAEWQLVELCLRTSGLGRPLLHSKRELLNAIFYQLRAGGAWHVLPHDLPPWRTVYKQFETWREQGTWDRLLTGPLLAPPRGGANNRRYRFAVGAHGR